MIDLRGTPRSLGYWIAVGVVLGIAAHFGGYVLRTLSGFSLTMLLIWAAVGGLIGLGVGLLRRRQP